MNELKVKIWDAHEYICANCDAVNKVTTEVIYADELEYNPRVKALLDSLNLSYLFNKKHICISIYKNINSAFKELVNNTEAYKKYKQEIETVKIFLWGIRLTIEEYPEGQIQFITPTKSEEYEKQNVITDNVSHTNS